MKYFIYTTLFSVMMSLLSCSSSDSNDDTGGSAAPMSTVVIGTQTWMSKNLDVTSYRNGDPIPQVQDPIAWKNQTTGAWCYYENSTANGTVYGKLYNWYAVNDPRGLAPEGYHIPSDAEWTTLTNFLGGEVIAGGKMKATSSLWTSPNTGATNSSGFTGLPSGARIDEEGTPGDDFTYNYINTDAGYWSSSLDGEGDPLGRRLTYNDATVQRFDAKKNTGIAVRCIKDDLLTDIDGNVYSTVVIGSQIWTKENLEVSRYRNGDPIPQVQDPIAWKNQTTGAWCYYENNTANGAVYGKLYNWYAVNDSRGLAPEGYHIPNNEEWTTLTNFLGGEDIAGGKMKATSSLWTSPNTGATNSSGFTGLPSGARMVEEGSISDDLIFNYLNTDAGWWSSSLNNKGKAIGRHVTYDKILIEPFETDKNVGIAIRCVKD